MSEFNVRDNLKTSVQSAVDKLTQQDSCGYDSASNDLYYTTLTATQSGGFGVADFPLKIAIPAREIVIVATTPGSEAEQIYMHFSKLGKQPGAPAVLIDGTENWLSFQPAQVAASSQIGRGWKFTKPMPSVIYFDIGQSTGWTTLHITFVLSGIESQFTFAT